MARRVVGIGQRVAGDDGVGLAVLDELERRELPEATSLLRISDPVELVSLFDSEDGFVLVDAVLGAPPGVVLDLSLRELSGKAPQPTSSHGIGVAGAIELAGVLSDRERPPNVRVVAVTIARPERYGTGLSPEVAAAVPRAADRVLELLTGF